MRGHPKLRSERRRAMIKNDTTASGPDGIVHVCSKYWQPRRKGVASYLGVVPPLVKKPRLPVGVTSIEGNAPIQERRPGFL